MGESTIGDQELALLRQIAARDGVTVGEMAETFGRDRGLARSTVLTMMERLRKKGRLTRRPENGIFRYRAHETSAEVMQGAIERFVERHLGGSVSPFLAYLTDAGQLKDDELRELAEVIEKLRAERRRSKRSGS